MKKFIVFSGAGISAESGLKTFRDFGGLWENYKIEDVATQEAFLKNPKLVLNFYNLRRKQLLESVPNVAHFAINDLSTKYNVSIITQNVDDLHERSGSKNVLYLHGNLTESRSTIDHKIYDIKGSELNLGDLCPNGGQLRPNVVWFGEEVPFMYHAISIAQEADFLLIVGTSLNVYPAASIVSYASNAKKIIIVDPNFQDMFHDERIEIIKNIATKALPKIVEKYLNL